MLHSYNVNVKYAGYLDFGFWIQLVITGRGKCHDASHGTEKLGSELVQFARKPCHGHIYMGGSLLSGIM